MAKKRKKQNEFLAQQRENALWNHIWALGLYNIPGYLYWCESRGFSADTKKSPLNFRQEMAHHRKLLADKHLRNSRAARNPMDIIAAICNGNTEAEEVESVPLREVCYKITSSGLTKKELPALGEFLTQLWEALKTAITARAMRRTKASLYRCANKPLSSPS